MTSAVTTLVRCLTLVSVMPPQNVRSTRAYGMTEKWFVNDENQLGVFLSRERLWPRDTTECTCSCEMVQTSPTKKLLTGKTDESHRTWNDAEGGKSDDDDDDEQTIDWSSDDQTGPSEADDTMVDYNGRDNSNRDNGIQDNSSNNNNIIINAIENLIDNAIDTLDTPDRYKGYTWGHGSRFPWKSLRDLMCLRQPCELDSDCCLRWNICDRSAKVCSNCWYGHPCLSERDCCHDFPYCQRTWKKDGNGHLLSVEGGRCADRR